MRQQYVTTCSLNVNVMKAILFCHYPNRATRYGCRYACGPSANQTSVAVQQSKVRQALTTLNSLTYHITDGSILQTLQDTFTPQIDLCNQHLLHSGCLFPMRRQQRILQTLEDHVSWYFHLGRHSPAADKIN